MPRPPVIALTAVSLLVASLAAQGAAPPRPQQPLPSAPQPQVVPPVSYGVDVALVEVDAVVTDAEGRVIRDLRADEVQVFEDGVPQLIDRMSFVEIPIERGRPVAGGVVPAAQEVRTNLQRFEGRLYVLLLDDLHTASSRADRVRGAATRFIEENLDPADLAAVVHLSGTVGAGQGFTSDRRLLLASVGRFSGRKLRSEALNLIDKYNEELISTGRSPDPERIRDPEEPARADDARVAFDSIARIARQLGPLRGRRKALLWFGEGLAYDMFDASGRRQRSLVLESARRAVAEAGRANLVIYGVDARGLPGTDQEAMQVSGAPNPSTGMDPSRLAREQARSQDNLRQISSDTGGFAVVNTSSFAQAFERVVEETSAYYVLGYYPKNERSDGAYRSLDVRVTRPGASVKARRGYTLSRSPAGTAASDLPAVPAALREALTSPVPVPGLSMAVHAAAFKGKTDKASVLVTIEYAASAFQGRDGLDAGDQRIEAFIVALDAEGKVQARDQATVDLRARADTVRALTALGLRTHARLELAPGRYQLRVAGLMPDTNVAGSVHYDFEVPAFSGRVLQLSGVELTCVVAAYVPTAHVDERMRGALPAPPTTMRDFRNDDQLAAYVEAYRSGAVPETDVTFTTTVREPGGRVLMKRSETRKPGDLKRAQGGYSVEVPLAGLAPGDYVLRLEAAGPASEPAGRDVPFRVWAVPPPEPARPAAPTGAPPGAEAPAPAAVVVPVVKGAMSGVREAREVVARTDAEWQALWGTLPMKRAAPAVTFGSTMIVSVFLGERPTAGFEPEITGMRREGDVLVVEWRERTPPNAGNPPAVTTPFVVAGVPIHGGPVRFEKKGGEEP